MRYSRTSSPRSTARVAGETAGADGSDISRITFDRTTNPAIPRRIAPTMIPTTTRVPLVMPYMVAGARNGKKETRQRVDPYLEEAWL